MKGILGLILVLISAVRGDVDGVCVGLHCGRIGAMVVEVGAPEARALVARGAVSTNQLLGTQRTSKLTQSCLQNISKFSQFVSVSNAQLLGTQQTSK